MTNWFFSLPLNTALGVVFFGSILIFSLGVVITDWMVKQVVQHRIAATDEFEYQDDVYAELTQPKRFMPITDVVKSDDEFRMIDLASFTCSRCHKQGYCSFAYDLYNTEDDCLDAK